MVHKESADEIVAVTKASRLGLVRCEQQARILDAPGCQYEEPGCNGHPSAGKRRDPDARNRGSLRIGFNVDCVCEKKDANALRLFEIRSVQLAKAHRRTEMRNRIAYVARDKRNATYVATIDCLFPMRGLEIVRSEFQ
jgi:hypothetical protein